jgi:heme oxygenase
MSAVLDRVDAKTKDWDDPAFAEKLNGKPLSKVMRRETWSDHARAEYSDFEQALVRGTLSIEAYRQMLRQTLPIYEALEARAAELADDPVVGAIVDPRLARSAKIAADLDFYFDGPSWREIELFPVTTEYVDRVRAADPARFVAHHYTRYLADLSGGLMIDAAIKQAYSLDGDGRRYYDFADLGDPVEFKKGYREALDGLPVDVAAKRAIVEEVMVAYEFNIEMIAELEARFLEEAGA